MTHRARLIPSSRSGSGPYHRNPHPSQGSMSIALVPRRPGAHMDQCWSTDRLRRSASCEKIFERFFRERRPLSGLPGPALFEPLDATRATFRPRRTDPENPTEQTSPRDADAADAPGRGRPRACDYHFVIIERDPGCMGAGLSGQIRRRAAKLPLSCVRAGVVFRGLSLPWSGTDALGPS